MERLEGEVEEEWLPVRILLLFPLPDQSDRFFTVEVSTVLPRGVVLHLLIPVEVVTLILVPALKQLLTLPL